VHSRWWCGPVATSPTSKSSQSPVFVPRSRNSPVGSTRPTGRSSPATGQSRNLKRNGQSRSVPRA
jgi:hypothetical protein